MTARPSLEYHCDDRGKDGRMSSMGRSPLRKPAFNDGIEKGDAIYSDPRLPHDWHMRDHSATTLLMVMTQ